MTELKRKFESIRNGVLPEDSDWQPQVHAQIQSLRAIESADAGRLENEFFGEGPLQDLLKDELVTEILINGPGMVWFERDGHKQELKDGFLSDWSYERFISNVCAEAHQSFDRRNPEASGRWKDFRFQVIAPPLTKKAPAISLRRLRSKPWELSEWIGNPNCLQIPILKELVTNKKTILVSGPTGSGKTALASALIGEVPKNERVVILEDTPEIQSPNFASLSLLTRASENEELKNYSLQDLVKMSLRLRPDRIMIGEVRGGEAKDWLMALSTGHDGGITTVHASNAASALRRLELLVQMACPQWSTMTVRELIFQNIYAVVQLEMKNGSRRIESLQKVHSLEPESIRLEPLNIIKRERRYNDQTQADLHPQWLL